MSISDRYLTYLDHFGPVVPVRDLHAALELKDAVALRHDVDHDIDVALEMAFWEHQRGVRSSFYILHTAGYMADPRIVEKCLQIQDFGHEIGIHVNLLTQWTEGEVEDPQGALAMLLERFREAGVEVSGVSSHGDPACYRSGFINYWMFAELRPADPHAEEDGKTAEGIRDAVAHRRIPYPHDHILRAPNGRSLKLWSTSLTALGLAYDAIHVPWERYFTDSGGGWIRTPDPLGVDLQHGRSQILIHPIHWRGERRTFFFLSTARSGSKWLATVLDRASSVSARHEFVLNHQIVDGALTYEHRTGERFRDLVEQPDEAEALLTDIRPWFDDLDKDHAEVNVYLASFLPQLKRVFPNATLVSLRRDPALVFRSLVNRSWYDTPFDDRHPRMSYPGWETLDQYEKCAVYIAQTVKTLLEGCAAHVALETLAAGPARAHTALADLGIAFYPRLAAGVYETRVNANTEDEFPGPGSWPPAARRAFNAFCAPVRADFGYGAQVAPPSRTPTFLAPSLLASKDWRSWWRHLLMPWRSSQVLDVRSLKDIANGRAGGVLTARDSILEFRPQGTRHAFVVLGNTRWRQLEQGCGWPVRPGATVTGRVVIDGAFVSGTFVRIMLLGYRDGALTEQRTLGTIGIGQPELLFGFQPKYRVERLAIGLYMPKGAQPSFVRLRHFQLQVR